jgi:hypothetical protein
MLKCQDMLISSCRGVGGALAFLSNAVSTMRLVRGSCRTPSRATQAHAARWPACDGAARRRSSQPPGLTLRMCLLRAAPAVQQLQRLTALQQTMARQQRHRCRRLSWRQLMAAQQLEMTGASTPILSLAAWRP